jgi:hypothetical protein
MAKLTSKKRNAMKTSTFAIPGRRAYPIPDRSHAANALSRVSANGTPAEKATVRAKVHAKYPTMGKMHAGGVVPADGNYTLKEGETVLPVQPHTGHWEIDGKTKKFVCG